MTDLHTAAKQALEALESYAPGDYSTGHVIHPSCDEDAVIKAITALRQALAYEALDRMAENELALGLDYTLTQTGVNIGERAEKAYEAAKERGWVGVSDERLMEMPAQQEPFGHVTVRRLSQRFENHADQYHFYPAGQSPYLDNVDELHAVYTRPQAREPLMGGDDRRHIICLCPDCTKPARELVGLTDAEIRDWWRIENGLEDCNMAKLVDFTLAVRAIEAKLKEKNT